MTMHMTITMSMNIYIKPELELRLREQTSMSGLVNHLLESYFKDDVRRHFGSRTSETPNPMVLKKQERHYNPDDFKDSGELTIEPLDQ